jgi:hypothetical protein
LLNRDVTKGKGRNLSLGSDPATRSIRSCACPHRDHQVAVAEARAILSAGAVQAVTGQAISSSIELSILPLSIALNRAAVIPRVDARSLRLMPDSIRSRRCFSPIGIHFATSIETYVAPAHSEHGAVTTLPRRRKEPPVPVPLHFGQVIVFITPPPSWRTGWRRSCAPTPRPLMSCS